MRMSDLTVEKVIKSLSTSELIDALTTFLEDERGSVRLWPILNEIERRDPLFEI
jgi:hypothetical protein